MDGSGSPGRAGSAGRYLSVLGAAAFGLCAAGWLALTPFAFGYRGRSQDAAVTNLATGAGLAAVCLLTLAAATVAWRRRLRSDGVLAAHAPARVRRRAAREAATGAAPDPDQLLAALRELLIPIPGSPAEPVTAEPAEAAGPETAEAAGPETAEAAGPETAEAGSALTLVPGPRTAAERPDGIAAIESMLARSELRMPGYEDEETW